MTRAVLVAVPVAAMLAALLGASVPVAFALALAGLLGVAVGIGLWAVQRGRVRALATAINAWLGPEEHEPVAAPGGPAWQELAIAANALGAAFDRRGRRLTRSRELRKQLVDAIAEPAILFGDDSRLVCANAAARQLFGMAQARDYTPAQAFGSAQLAAAVTEARDTGNSVGLDVTFDDREVSALAAPVGDEILFLATDRTERHLVDAVRRDFVTNASHELKTPVSGIQALAEALTVTIGRDESRAVALATRLDDEAQRLGKLVHDLLDLRRLEEGGPLDRTPVDLVELLEAEVERVRASADKRDISLDLRLPGQAVVVGSSEDLRLIVANLLDNAVGYNQRGGEVTVSLTRDGADWVLEVTDTGIGIARQDIDRVFERFYRVDVARSRATGGTGLGLSIVRHAVKRHGGTVAVDSILGEGTTFAVSLPVEPAP